MFGISHSAIYFRDCFGLNSIDRKCYQDTRLEQLAKTDRNPVEETEYRQLLQQSNVPYFKGGNLSTTGQFQQFAAGAPFGAGGGFDPIAQAQKLLEFQRQANQPAISSLQASIPETEQRFATEQTRLAGEKEPLKQRYANIIDQLTGREKQDVALAQQRTGREFGYRGIPASSTLFLDELQRAESPIRQAYGGQIKEVGLEQEAGLRGIDQLLTQLAGQSVEAKRTIQNAIGQLQSGDPGSALQAAMSILSLQQNQAQFKQQQALSERELTEYKIPSLTKKETVDPYKQFLKVGEGESVFDLATLQAIYNKGKTKAPGDGGGGISPLIPTQTRPTERKPTARPRINVPLARNIGVGRIAGGSAQPRYRILPR